MGRTIIQPIGPLYGEAVNGTVFGRPNGSIYIPESNTIDLSFSITPPYVCVSGTKWAICDSGKGLKEYHAVARAQDNASYIVFELAEDSDFDTVVASASFTAGQFNVYGRNLTTINSPTLDDGATYYGRAVLMAGSGVAVAVSATAEITGVNP